MFTQFAGLSLIIHLLIILTAKVLNRMRHSGESSAFQTYGKGGGVVFSRRVNIALSYSIVILVSTYMILLTALALRTAFLVGANEPHRRLFRAVYEAIFDGILAHPALAFNGTMVVFIVALIFVYEHIANTLPVRFTKAVVDFFYNVAFKVSVVFVTLSKTISERLTQMIGGVYTGTIGRPFVISVRAILLRVAFAALVSLVVFGLPLLASAQIVEPGFESEVVASNLTLATTMDYTPDGRIFIAEKSGTVRVVKNGVLLPDPLITLTDINTFGDRGLLGIAVDPQFETNGYVYLSYTYENTPGLNIAGPKTGRIVRITVIGDTALESSKVVLVGTVGGDATNTSCTNFLVTADCIASDSNSHSVGGLRFGPDGKLYATIGDGADFTDVDPRALRAQNIDSLNGKMLRINKDGTAPTDNPFYNGSSTANRSKVYALGFRNAFRFNFNPTTGQLYAGDVGWSSWEEVNRVVSGANYGWPCREGNVATTYGCTPSSTATNPLYTYAHNASGAGSITGGAFASFNAYPDAYDTSFFIGDYAQMWMKRLVLNASGTAVVSVQDFIPDSVWPVEITAGPDGNVYYLDIVFGTLNRLTHTTGNRRPVVTITRNPSSGLAPLSVNFSSAGTMDPDGDPLTYAWEFGDGGTANTANPSHIYTTNGAYNAVLTVTDSNGSAVTKSASVLVGNQAPTATIVSPSSGSLYTELQMLTVTGAGTDPETGTLPPSAYSWQVILHHNVHTHTLQSITGTSTITFQADDHNASDVYLEVILTVTDPAGLTNTKNINLYLNNGVGSGNLVSNASLEVEGSVATSPLDWYQGWFGVMNPIFTYPVAGFAGSKAARVEVTTYTSGSARWYFTPAFVTPGAQYTFSDMYTATVPTEIVIQYGRSDGTFQYAYVDTVPAVTQPTRVTRTFTVPAGVETATVFHGLVSTGVLTLDDFALALAGGDVIAPDGAITSPANNATVTGVVPVAVSANDNTGVASAQLLVNGALVGVADSEAPFNLSWDTSALPNGPYTLAARILDTSANQGTSPNITVTVSNGTGTTSPNLFDNGSFEIVNGTNPRSWQPGGTGTHTAVYSYPVPGFTGNGIAINVTKYDLNDTGDARWVHAPIPVTSGIRYTYETMYKATTITDVLGRYRFANGTEHYFGLIKEIPGTATWTKTSNSFVPPVGAVDVTFGHAISAGGATLTMDDVKLFVSGTGTPSEINVPTIDFIYPAPNATLSGVVTVSATSSDDTGVVGVFFAMNGSPFGIEDLTAPYQEVLDTRNYPNGTYVLKATTRDPYGNNDKKEINVVINNVATTTSNLVTNGTLETAGTAGNPASWNRGGWGTNTRTYTYPATGFAGNGATIAISGYTSGDAKWYFNDVAVTPGTQYTVSDRYNSTVSSQALIRYTLTGGTNQYLTLQTLPSTAGAWQTFTGTFTPPANTVSMTLFHLIAGNGSLTLDNMSVTGPGGAGDTTAPAVAVTSPTAGATLTGTTTIAVTATDAVGVTGVTLLVDGNAVGVADTTAPYSFVLNTATLTNGAHTISARGTDAAGNIGTATNVAVTVSNSTSTPDTTLPTASVTSPTAGATLTGTTTVAVTAADNIGVTGVTLLVDGNAVGAPDTTAPYSFVFNTATLANGAHTISARASDLAGNLGTSAVVNVTVTNGTSTGTNLVTNGTFETAGTAGNPASWNRGGWGTNTRTYTYPATGFAGNGATIAISGYTSGDAKWYFNDVAVTPGTQYTVSDRYNSTVSSQALIRYTLTGGTNQYLTLQTLPSTAGAWQTFTGTFTPPANTVSMTLFHLIAGNGSLTLDNMSVTGPGGAGDTTAPAVAVTSPTAGATLTGTTTIAVTATDAVGVTGVTLLVDGNAVGVADTTAPYSFVLNTATLTNGAHTISARGTDAAGNIGTATNVAVTVSNSTSTPDTTLPTASVTSPTAGATLTGTTTVAVTAADNIGVTGVTLLVDGNAVGAPDTTAPYSFVFNTATLANGAHTISARASDLAGNLGTSAVVNVTVTNSTSTPGDIIAPTVNVTSPTAGAVLNGSRTITVTATDNVGVVGVNLLVDGSVVGASDTTSPYSFVLDTATLVNGAHTISARASDAVGNQGTAPTVAVTVSNTTTPPTGDNLILNGDFEIAGTGGNPLHFNRGGWGTNTRTYTYPVTGKTGNGAQITMSNYTNGDAKWYSDEVAVTPNVQYTFGYAYTASVPTNITIRYTKTDGTFLYVGIGTFVANANWTTGSFSFVPPVDVVTATVMHILTQAGTLTIDDQSLITGNPNAFARGKVSFSFDDGWLEHTTIAGPTLDAAGIDGTFYIISDYMQNVGSTELVQNSTLETAGVGGDPLGWNRGGWGTNTRTFTYPATGFSGNGAQVTVSDYVNGDAKWYFTPVGVTPATQYVVSERYNSTVQSELLLQFTKADGSFMYQFLRTLPSTGGVWQTVSETITTQTDVTEVTLFHTISGNGSLTIDNVSVASPNQLYASQAQIATLAQNGHEIGAHTETHPQLPTLTTAEKQDEINGSRQALLNAGFSSGQYHCIPVW